VRLTRCDVRDHINCRKNNRWRSYRFYEALQRLKSPACDICEIIGAPRFRSFSTQSAKRTFTEKLTSEKRQQEILLGCREDALPQTARPGANSHALIGEHKVYAIDPLVNPGNPPRRHQTRSKADPACKYHRMVTLAQSTPSGRSARPSQKNTTVMPRLSALSFASGKGSSPEVFVWRTLAKIGRASDAGAFGASERAPSMLSQRRVPVMLGFAGYVLAPSCEVEIKILD
jgi:hypothetical protein